MLSKKLAETLVLSDTEHDLAMQINENSSQEPAANPNDSKSWEFLQVKGEIHSEIRSEQSSDGDCRMKRQH